MPVRRKKRTLRRKVKASPVVLREDERHLRRNGTLIQKNYSILKGKKNVGTIILDYDFKAYPEQWASLPVKKNDLGVASIKIDKEHRGKGIGTKALKKIGTIAKKAHRRRVVLVVYGWNTKAKKFYKTQGYKEIGQAKYLGKRETTKNKKAHVMAKTLK